jgi:hypothetical protein
VDYSKETPIEQVSRFNSLAPTIKFTMEKEIYNRINFLDITINKEINNFSFNIFQKPTTTDVIIPQDSCHPHEHKHAAIRYMLNRLNTYQLNDDNIKAELNTIKQIISNNGCNNSTIQQLDKPTTKPSPQQQ